MSTGRPAVLLLGGFAVAWNQRYLRAAADRGLTVLVIDAAGPHVSGLLERWRTGELAATAPAEVALLPAADLTAIVDRAASWADRYDVRGVCALREECVEPAAVVADLLGLPSPGLRAARVCRNKYLQRRYLAPWSPASALVGPADRMAAAAGWTAFPAVVKPTGRLASSGVRLVTNAAQLHDGLAVYDAAETLLFEERAAGPEFSVESLSRAGAVQYIDATRKRTTETDSAYFVEMAHTTPPPDLDPADRARLLATHHAVLERLGFDTGMAHAEYRQVPGGEPRLIEIAARPPGDSIMALHWLATGTPLEDALIGIAVGEDVSHPPATRIARQVYLPHRAGVLAGLTVDRGLGVVAQAFDPGELRAQIAKCGTGDDPPAVRCVVALKASGTPLLDLRESGDRAAMFVIDATTPGELDALEGRCLAAITLDIQP